MKVVGLVELSGAGATAGTVVTTGTWCAYNDWGGSNHYQGLTGPEGRDFAARVSLLRPWARGFVRWPEGAPRIPHASPLLEKPRYPHMEFARANGVSKKYASSGWAAFERPFALWCEAQGIALDYATQHDLHREAGLLDGHERALIVGHDEYWSLEMYQHARRAIDAGANAAFFCGNSVDGVLDIRSGKSGAANRTHCSKLTPARARMAISAPSVGMICPMTPGPY